MQSFLIFQFFPKALTALVQLLSTDTSPPTVEHEIKQTYEDWSTAIYGLAEQGGITLDPLKADFVCELCSAGMDKLAQEVMKFWLFFFLAQAFVANVEGFRIQDGCRTRSTLLLFVALMVPLLGACSRVSETLKCWDQCLEEHRCHANGMHSAIRKHSSKQMVVGTAINSSEYRYKVTHAQTFVSGVAFWWYIINLNLISLLYSSHLIHFIPLFQGVPCCSW